MKAKVMNLLREIATGLAVVVATLVILYVALGAACLILGLCIHLSSDLFANYFGLAILTAAWIVVGRVSGCVRLVESVGLVGRTAKFMIPVTSRERHQPKPLDHSTRARERDAAKPFTVFSAV
jgi:hypothetical protein